MTTLLDELEQAGALSSTALALPLTITRDQYEALGALLGAYDKKIKWAIGDYIIGGEQLFGEEAYQLQESLGISEESRRQYVRVSLAVEPSRRRHELSWSHHRSVAALDPAEQDRLLSAAVENRWTRGELDAHFRQETPWRPDPARLASAAMAVYKSASFEDGRAITPVDEMRTLGAVLGVVE